MKIVHFSVALVERRKSWIKYGDEEEEEKKGGGKKKEKGPEKTALLRPGSSKEELCREREKGDSDSAGRVTYRP